MPLFPWSDRYLLGIASIDEQHVRLVEVLNNLHDAMRARQGAAALEAQLEALLRYTIDHFAHEERLFRQHGYPDGPAHTREHEQLRQKVLAFRKQLKANELALPVEVMSFLRDWLSNHILVSDAAYVEFLKSRGAR